MTDIENASRPVRPGDKVVRDTTTRNQGKVQLGDAAPVFAPRPIRAGDKVVRDTATRNQDDVRLGDAAPVFGR
jgi:hypothetical protein